MFTIGMLLVSLFKIGVFGLDNTSLIIDLQKINIDITQFYYPSSLTIICPLTSSNYTGSALGNEQYLYSDSSTLPPNVKLEKFKNSKGTAHTPVFVISKPIAANTGEYTCCYPTVYANETKLDYTCYKTKLTVTEFESFDLTKEPANKTVSVSLGRTNNFWLIHENVDLNTIICKVNGLNAPENIKTNVLKSYTQLVILNTLKKNLGSYDCTIVCNGNEKPTIINKQFFLQEATVATYPWNSLPGNSGVSNTISIFLLVATTVLFFRNFYM